MKSILNITLFFITSILIAQGPIIKDLGSFSEVKVFDLIKVNMVKSDVNKITIDGQNKRDVEVVNKNGKLKIRMNLEESYDGSNTKITLYYTKVSIIDANEGAKINVDDVLDQFEIELKAQEGGEITANLKTTLTQVKAVTGGIVNTSGYSKKQEVSINTGGIYNAKELKTATSEVSVSAGGEAFINATDFADLKVRAGGDIYVYGNPKEINEKTILGGRVKRM